MIFTPITLFSEQETGETNSLGTPIKQPVEIGTGKGFLTSLNATDEALLGRDVFHKATKVLFKGDLSLLERANQLSFGDYQRVDILNYTITKNWGIILVEKWK